MTPHPPSRRCSPAPTTLAPAISDRADEIERARRLPADLVDALVDDSFFRLAAADLVRRARRHPARSGGRARSTRRRRRLDGLDRDDRWDVVARSARTAARRHSTVSGRLRPPSSPARSHRWGDEARARRVRGDRTVVVRQRLRARRLDLRQLHRAGERVRSAHAHRPLRAGPGDDRGHLARGRSARNRQPALLRRRRAPTGRTDHRPAVRRPVHRRSDRADPDAHHRLPAHRCGRARHRQRRAR